MDRCDFYDTDNQVKDQSKWRDNRSKPSPYIKVPLLLYHVLGLVIRLCMFVLYNVNRFSCITVLGALCLC